MILEVTVSRPMLSQQIRRRIYLRQSFQRLGLTFDSGQTIDLVELILDGIDSIRLAIPASIKDAIQEILVIDTKSFYLAYCAGNGAIPESISFSNDGQVTLFDKESQISVSSARGHRLAVPGPGLFRYLSLLLALLWLASQRASRSWMES